MQWYPAQAGMNRFRHSLEQIAFLMEQGVVQRSIIDLHDLPNVGLEDQFWLATSWLPRVSPPELKHVALIFPESGTYNQLVVESLLRIGKHFIHYEIQFFSSAEEALDWHIGQYDPAGQAGLEAEWDAPATPDALWQADRHPRGTRFGE